MLLLPFKLQAVKCASTLLHLSEPVHASALQTTVDLIDRVSGLDMPHDVKVTIVDALQGVIMAGDAMGHQIMLLYFAIMRSVM